MEHKSVNDIIIPSNPSFGLFDGKQTRPLGNPASGLFDGRFGAFRGFGPNAPPSPFEMPPSNYPFLMSSPPIVTQAAHEAAMAELAAIKAENALLIEKNKRLIAELELANIKLAHEIKAKQ